MSDYHARVRGSICYTADTCTLDPACPFIGGCRAVEARDDDLYFGPHPDDGSTDEVRGLMQGFARSRQHSDVPIFPDGIIPGTREREGGFLVPPGLRSDILASALETGLVRNYGETPPIPWRRRLKWRIHNARTRLGEIAYRVVAGEWPHNGEDDW